MAKKEEKAKAKKPATNKADKASKARKDNAADKKTKSDKEMSPLEKARAARAAGKGAKKPATKKAKAKLPTFKAPEEFKPHFLEIQVATEKDGLLSNGIKATRYVGRYDPDAPDKKKFDLGSYDQRTLQGILSRLSMVTYATNAAKRLPAKTLYQILLRVNRKSADGSLSILFKGISVQEKNEKTGRVKFKELDKKDPNYRKFRKASRILPAAFKAVLMPPKRTRGAKVEQDDE